MKKKYSTNTISFEMDAYVRKMILDKFNFELDQDEVIKKSYTFEIYDDDIINSPISHKIEKCYLNLEITNEEDINGLLKFLENLKLSLVKEEKKLISNEKVNVQIQNEVNTLLQTKKTNKK